MSEEGLRFARALEFCLHWETGGDLEDGGYTDDPDDPGKATRWGISSKAHPEADVEHLTREVATQIYAHDYWGPTGDRLRDLPEAGPLSMALFDWAVNTGKRPRFVAIRELQVLVGATADGVIGPKTRAAILRHAFRLVAHELCGRRRRFLSDLALRKPDLQKFSLGWKHRIDDLEQEIDRA